MARYGWQRAGGAAGCQLDDRERGGEQDGDQPVGQADPNRVCHAA